MSVARMRLGAALIFIGLVVAVAAIVLVAYIPGFTDKTILATSDISDASSAAYKSFARNDQADATPKVSRPHVWKLL
jgi:hypothetical protein